MQFWTNFAKSGVPGTSSNGIEWQKYKAVSNNKSNFMVLDRRSNLGMRSDNFSFSSLVVDLYKEDALTELENVLFYFKCLLMLVMICMKNMYQNIRVSAIEKNQKNF